jgi:hypothetical protein
VVKPDRHPDLRHGRMSSGLTLIVSVVGLGTASPEAVRAGDLSTEELESAQFCLDGMWNGLRAIQSGEVEATLRYGQNHRHDYKITFEEGGRLVRYEHDFESRSIRVVKNAEEFLLQDGSSAAGVVRFPLDRPPKAVGTKPFDPRCAGLSGANPFLAEKSFEEIEATPHGRVMSSTEDLDEYEHRPDDVHVLVWRYHSDRFDYDGVLRLEVDQQRDFRPIRKQFDLRFTGDEETRKEEVTEADWVEVDGVWVPGLWTMGYPPRDATVVFDWKSMNRDIPDERFTLGGIGAKPSAPVYDRKVIPGEAIFEGTVADIDLQKELAENDSRTWLVALNVLLAVIVVAGLVVWLGRRGRSRGEA